MYARDTKGAFRNTGFGAFAWHQDIQGNVAKVLQHVADLIGKVVFLDAVLLCLFALGCQLWWVPFVLLNL